MKVKELEDYQKERRFRILKATALAHWEEHLPKTLARLQKKGKAEEHLDQELFFQVLTIS